MTDRIRSFTVVLDRDARIDDADTIADAIRMIKGVSKVETGPITDMRDYLAREAVVNDLFGKVRDVFFPKTNETGKRS